MISLPPVLLASTEAPFAASPLWETVQSGSDALHSSCGPSPI